MIRFLTVLVVLLPAQVFADAPGGIVVNTGINITFVTAVQKLITFLAGGAASVITVVFLIGAGFTIASVGKPELLEKGKKMMKNSLIGLAIILGSYTIFRTVWYLLY